MRNVSAVPARPFNDEGVGSAGSTIDDVEAIGITGLAFQVTVSFPVPARMMSLPVPPVIVSPPSPASMLSLPPPPVIALTPVSPTMMSLPLRCR